MTTDTDQGRAHADKANEHLTAGFTKAIGLNYTYVTADRVAAEFTVGPDHHQPFGIVHGGVYCAVVETLASVAASYWFGKQGQVVGVNNNTDFMRAVREGVLRAEALPVHRGKLQQLWEVTIVDERDKLIARGKVRLANLPTGLTPNGGAQPPER
ncbi:MAG: PaaI family thioesterase [Mycobacteriaceae bacterium]|nr:PaaI family thioesterase [Mycobacteriaceae bacterium]